VPSLLAKLFDSIENEELGRYHSHQIVVFLARNFAYSHSFLFFSSMSKDVSDSECTPTIVQHIYSCAELDHLILRKVEDPVCLTNPQVGLSQCVKRVMHVHSCIVSSITFSDVR
jgi:hypothetical protein